MRLLSHWGSDKLLTRPILVFSVETKFTELFGPNSASSLFHEAGCTRELSRGLTLSCPAGWRLGGILSLAFVSAKYVTLGDYMRLPLFYVSIGHSSLYLHLVRNSHSSPVRFGAKS